MMIDFMPNPNRTIRTGTSAVSGGAEEDVHPGQKQFIQQPTLAHEDAGRDADDDREEYTCAEGVCGFRQGLNEGWRTDD